MSTTEVMPTISGAYLKFISHIGAMSRFLVCYLHVELMLFGGQRRVCSADEAKTAPFLKNRYSNGALVNGTKCIFSLW